MTHTKQFLISAATLVVALWLPLGAQQATPSNLTDLLVSKGILTSEEVSQLASTDPATERALLDLLVSKGVITSSEAQGLTPMAEPQVMVATTTAPATTVAPAVQPAPSAPKSTLVKAKEKTVETLTFSGRIQGQWDVLSTDYDNAEDPGTENNILLRRLYLGADAQFADNLKGSINLDMGNGAEGDAQLEKAVIVAGLGDHHSLSVGFQKVRFGYEEYTSSSKIKAVERSVGTRFFTEDFNARFAGVFLAGEYDSGLYFDIAATNPEGNSVSASSSTDKLAIWGRLGWAGDIGDISIDTGVAGGSIPDTEVDGRRHSVWDLYVNFNTGRFNLLAEILGAELEDERITGGDTQPVTFTLIPSYHITDDLEIVARYSQIDADGSVGGDISRVFRRAPENGSAVYEDIQAYYLGGNWYIRGNAFKLSAGYEWAKFEDNLTGNQGDAEVSGFRTRLQLLF